MKRAFTLSFLLFVAAAPPVFAAEGSFLPAHQRVSAPMGARSLCQSYDWACATSQGQAALSQAQVNHAVAVNTRINRQVREVSDRRQYGRDEVWTLPTARGGDCEDIALLKKKTLVSQGLPPERLLLATALDTRRQAHAVLIMRTGSGDYVLDNLTNEIKHWQQTGYTFLRLQDPQAPHAWSAVFAGGLMGDRATAAPR